MIQNPARCGFNPNSLVPSVLTQGQADAIKTILAPVTDWSGQLIYPGSSVSEIFNNIADDELSTQAPAPNAAQPWGAPPLIQGQNAPSNWFYAYNMLDYVALYEPNINLNSNDFINGAVIPTPIRKTVYKNMALNLADDPSLVANYLRTGKKLIMYHGYGDPIISPYRTVLFFEDLAKLTGGYDELRRAARLFMVPDMGHCSGSTAPDEFGNGTEPAGYPVDAQHDVLTALEAWVEKGQPPSSIIATHYLNDNPASGVVDRTMPLCPFPAEAAFDHQGDVNDAANWRCTDNKRLLRTGPNGRQAGVYGPEDQPAFPSDVIR